MYNIETQQHCADATYHKSQITHLLWYKNGTILASGDDHGHAALWSVGLHCKISLLAAFSTTPAGPVSAMLFLESAAIPALSYSVTTGTCTDIYLGDSTGSHNKLYTVPTLSPLLGLFSHSMAGQLVLVAASGELFVYGNNAQDPKQWEQVVKLRIGAGIKSAGGESSLMVAWVAEHTLASASGQDSTVHMYNLETEDNYVLTIGAPSCPQAHNTGSDDKHAFLAAILASFQF